MLVRSLSLARSILKRTGLLPVVKRILYRPTDAGARQRPASGLRYRLKLLIEQGIYASVEQVHDVPAMEHYCSEKYLAPLLESFGFRTDDELFIRELLEAMERCAGPHRILSVGSGNCDTEIRFAERLQAAGRRDFVIECMDINAEMLRRGAMQAKSQGVGEFIVPLRGDFNAWRPAGQVYTAIIAYQSLHHVVNLEGLFDAIRDALLPKGIFLTSDMIGRNGHMRWPEAHEIVNEFWRRLPASYRHNHLLGATTEEYVNYDCSKAGFEGIRAQDILPLLIERFSFKMFIPFRNVLDAFIDRGIGPNFDPERAWDRDFIDQVHAADVAAIESGRIKPTHLLASMTVRPLFTCRYPGNLSPDFCVRRP
ncbi:MAG TPA: class I SAM-dependent methyltransferase [Burkholderiales bacterium]|nr:class I SAM-dependent methyltransferase [Burkholderiales bacterium]